MLNKFTKAVAVTPNDSTDLTTVSDGIYVGAGCYTNGIDNLHSSITTDAGEPVGWWRADDNTGNSLNNRGSDSTPAVASTSGSTVPPNTATLNEKNELDFNGTDQYISVADSSVYRLGTGEFSLVIVFSLDNAAAEQFIWCKDNFNSDWGLLLDRHGYLHFKTIDTPDLSSVGILNTGTTYIVEISKDSNDDGHMYINGQLVDSETDAFDVFDATLTDTMYLACRQGLSSLTRHMNGQIAEFIMWAGGNTLSSGDRTRLMDYLNARYINTPQFVDVSTIIADNTSNVDTKRLERGVVHPLNISRVRSTGTNGTSIVALYK